MQVSIVGTTILTSPCCRCDNASSSMTHSMYNARPLEECSQACVALDTNHTCGGFHRLLLHRTDGTAFTAWNSTSSPSGHCAMLDVLSASWQKANCSSTASYVCVHTGVTHISTSLSEETKSTSHFFKKKYYYPTF